MLLLSGWTVDRLFPLNLTRFYDRSPVVLDKNQELLTVLLANDQRWRLPVQWKEISPLFIQMLIAYEDKRFFYHFGIDPVALLRAVWQWAKTGKIVSGASTLTLQTVKLLEPSPRTFKNKLRECLRALQLEYHFSKREILEMYLTLAPYGANIEGVRAGSLVYFGKEPKHLTIAESALLVVLPQRPTGLRPDRYPEQAKKHRNKVIARMQLLNIFDENTVLEAFEDKIPLSKQGLPRQALHLAHRLISANPQSNTYKTFIDKFLQKQVEDFLYHQVQFLENTQTIAALVVDNKSRKIIAYVGSADFHHSNRCGFVDMIRAIRSPGSTLKPFIYMLGFEEGIIFPETIIEDVPTQFHDYAPNNFENTFYGMVSIREALQRSLNVPAVTVLEKIGVRRFAARLQTLGITLKFPYENTEPSLALALGGVGMSLSDIVALYCALANEGEFLPLSLYAEERDDLSRHASARLAKPFAVQQVNQILQQMPSPEGFMNWQLLTQHTPIGYKTGTSYGFHDAWAIGYTADFTVGVWMGRPDGSSTLNQTGGTHAAPVLFKLFDLLSIRKQRSFTASIEKSVPSTLPSAVPHFKQRHTLYKNKENNFHLGFPREGMILSVEKDETGWKSIPIEVVGGKPPFYCFENGYFLFKTMEKRSLWKPRGAGFWELTLLDAEGQSSSATVQLQSD